MMAAFIAGEFHALSFDSVDAGGVDEAAYLACRIDHDPWRPRRLAASYTDHVSYFDPVERIVRHGIRRQAVDMADSRGFMREQARVRDVVMLSAGAEPEGQGADDHR